MSVWFRPPQCLALCGLLLLGLAGGCGSRQGVDESQNPGSAAAVTSPAPAASTPTAVEDPAGEGFQSTVINPIRTAYLTTQQPGAQINLRSQPTTQAATNGQGQAGNQVQLLRIAEGEGGYSWYFLKLAQSETEGWVRGDFIDTSGQAAPAAAAPATASPTPPCGQDRQEALFETQTFSIHLCQGEKSLRYIGVNKTNQETLTTDDVRNTQGTYIAINGNYQYHIDENSLAVYQVNDGSYTQLAREDVIRHEQFLY
ncbi:MAG: SH3 domain-containing protein [Nodosilinea sp.]